MVTFITQDLRIICIGDTIEIEKVELNDNNLGKYGIVLTSLNEKSKRVVLAHDDDEYIVNCVFTQAIGLLRSAYVKVLDFDAMYRNPNIDDYDKDWTFNWETKKRGRGRPKRK